MPIFLLVASFRITFKLLQNVMI